jgi:hypothetical protein
MLLENYSVKKIYNTESKSIWRECAVNYFVTMGTRDTCFVMSDLLNIITATKNERTNGRKKKLPVAAKNCERKERKDCENNFQST